MKKYTILFSLILFFASFLLQAEETYMYRLCLKDKGTSTFLLENPQEFLSEKSIQRRIKQGYSVDESDLPFAPAYFEAIQATGATIRTFSKWVNTVVVHFSNRETISELEKLDFVDTLYCVWRGSLPGIDTATSPEVNLRVASDDLNSYGASFTQIRVNNGDLLHNLGFYGSGISIAIIDGGFTNIDKIDFFDQTRIKEVKNFNHEITDILNDGMDHGTKVLSCMLAEKPGEFIGTAPKADYYLLRTEIGSEEFPVEEDYWIAALEYADSIGVDIVTTSLGYSVFDDPQMNHTHSQLDGKTVPASRAASLAASKGLLLLNSAGNEGNKNWAKIMVPSDADRILTVGSVTADLSISPFSSQGYSTDGRVKPDVLAMGSQTKVVNRTGSIITDSGTSFSTPIMAGLTACLWGAFPDRTNLEIMQMLRQTASSWDNPDIYGGYGIADVMEAYRNFFDETALNVKSGNEYVQIKLQGNSLYVNTDEDLSRSFSLLSVYSSLGNPVMLIRDFSSSIDVSSLPKGIYIIYLELNGQKFVKKIVKI